MSEKVGKIGLVSLGCPKATVDSERIVTQLRTQGYEMTPSYEEADLIVVNTCGFIDAAEQESLEAIAEAMDENGKVIVTGCLGAKKGLVEQRFPNVLAVTGPHASEQVMTAVQQYLPQPEHAFTSLIPPGGYKLTPRHYAYLKISEGCNHRCRFCIIPKLRGDLQSRVVGEVLDEARALVDSGVKELLVVSQDTSAYGVDLKYKMGFWNGRPVKTRFYELVEALAELPAWIRLHYVYPYPHVDDIIPLMQNSNLLPYLDVPLQHASPRILKSMKRPADSENVLARIKRWREQCPQLTLRSTFIVGYPGETDEDFAMLLDFLEEAEIDRAGVFKYSPVEGAEANDLPDQVDEDIKEDRYEAFMHVQAEVSRRRLAAKVGKMIEVIIDSVEEDGQVVARSQGDAPEVDGCVFINTDKALSVGDRVDVRIESSDEYDLYGVLK